MTDQRDDVARAFGLAAEQLERAAAHCRIAARHFSERNVPRGCAHAFAALGDVELAREAIAKNAKLHASKSSIDADPGRES